MSGSETAKKEGKCKRFFNSIKTFAKNKPSLFIVIIIAIIFALLFITYEALHLTSTPTFCGMCHKDTEKGPGAEYYTWEKNVHAYAGVGCIDCHGRPGFFGYMRAKMGGLYDLYGEIVHSKEHKMEILVKGATDLAYAEKLVPNDWCLICHSDADNERIRKETMMTFMGVPMRQVDSLTNPEFRKSHGLPDIMTDDMPAITFSHDNHVNTLGLSCVSCHMGVAHANEFSNKTKMETCFTCHDAEREKNADIAAPANEDCASCHTMVVAQHDGTLLQDKGVEVTPPSIMVDLGVYGAENCGSCHADAFTPPTREVCGETCHGEGVTYEDMYDSQRAEFDAAKAPLDDLIKKFYQAREKMTAEQISKFNEFKDIYTYIANDKSKGMHNYDLAIITLEKARAIADELAGSLGIAIPVTPTE